MKATVADQLLRRLREWGVDRVFAYTGAMQTHGLAEGFLTTTQEILS